jgi:hypothetical protein
MKFCRRNVDNYMRAYIENCISLSFFRVSRFKELFLNCVSERINVDIPEWKGITWDINDNSRAMNFEESLIRFFDWHMNLFQHIENGPDVEEVANLIKKIESNRKWQIRV